MMIHVDVTFDPAKREATLRHRDLDLADAAVVLEGVTFDREDRRFDYGEIRVVSVGMLRGRTVVLVWTDRGDTPHIISMRNATKGETDEYFKRVG